MAANIVMSDLTNGGIVDNNGQFVWQGTGIFDKLISAVNDNIKVEYDNGRIVGQEYATVYLGALQSVIAQSMQFLQQEKLLEAQIDTEVDKLLTSAQNRLVMQAQESLYKRQKAGFDDNKQQKILESQLNAWGITFQDTSTPYIPTAINDASITTSMNAVRTDYVI